MKNKIIKSLIFVGVALYVISPIDLVPGVFIDDAIVLLLGFAANKRISTKQLI